MIPDIILNLCHRMPERMLLQGVDLTSFCARCTGLFIGSGTMLLLSIGRSGLRPVFSLRAATLCLTALLLDVISSYFNLLLSSNTSRFVTGWLGGGALVVMALCHAPRPSGAMGPRKTLAPIPITLWLALAITALYSGMSLDLFAYTGWFVYFLSVFYLALRVAYSAYHHLSIKPYPGLSNLSVTEVP